MEFLQKVKNNSPEIFALDSVLSTVFFQYDYDRFFLWSGNSGKIEYSEQEAIEKYQELTATNFEPRKHGGKRPGSGRKPGIKIKAPTATLYRRIDKNLLETALQDPDFDNKLIAFLHTFKQS